MQKQKNQCGTALGNLVYHILTDKLCWQKGYLMHDTLYVFKDAFLSILLYCLGGIVIKLGESLFLYRNSHTCYIWVCETFMYNLGKQDDL